MLKKLINECTIELKLSTVDPMLIKSGQATMSGPDMAFVQTYRKGRREPYLPGSSLKGVIRSQAERIARTLKSSSACEPFWNEEIQREVGQRASKRAETIWCGERLKQREKHFDERITNPTAYKDSCPACRLFGSTYYAGRLAVSDAYLISTPDRPSEHRLQQRDGVGIDRFTGGASKRAKFDLEVLTDAVFQCKIQIRNFEVWQLGWLAYVIQDLKDEMIQVGSGKSRGLGRVSGVVENVTISYILPDVNQLRDSEGRARLRGIGSLTSDDGYGFLPNDEALLSGGFEFLRPTGKLRHECRFDQGEDTALWFACAPKWDQYIAGYQVAPKMAHSRFVNVSQGEDANG